MLSLTHATIFSISDNLINGYFCSFARNIGILPNSFFFFLNVSKYVEDISFAN